MTEPTEGPRALTLATQLYLDYCAEEAFAAFGRAGVASIMLKGPAVARALYPPEERRFYGDIDLLVAPGDYERAKVTLSELGYRQRFPGAGLGEAGVYAEEYVRRSALIDLHLRYPGVSIEPEQAWRRLRDHASRVPFRSGEVVMLDTEAVALILALHAAKSPAFPIRDLGRALTQLGDDTWRSVMGLADDLGATEMVAVGLRRDAAGRALLTRLGVDPIATLEGELLTSGAPPLSLGVARLASTPGIVAKLRLAARELVPSPDGMRYWSPLARRGRLGLLIAYVWRPFWLARRLPFAATAWHRARRRVSQQDRAAKSSAGSSGRRPR